MNNMKTMILVTSSWNKRRTFKMIPTDKDCPYNECIFDLDNKVLAIISKEYKQNFHMIPELDMGGMPVKNTEERVKLDTYYEYFIEDKDEIVNFIKEIALNSSNYNYLTILDESFEEEIV